MAYQDVIKKVIDDTFKDGKSSMYDSEMARADKVIADRKAKGLDTAAQDKYKQQLKESSALGSVKREAYSSGADPSNIDMSYVKARADGGDSALRTYTGNVLGGSKKTTSLPSKAPRSTSSSSGGMMQALSSPLENITRAPLPPPREVTQTPSVGFDKELANLENKINGVTPIDYKQQYSDILGLVPESTPAARLTWDEAKAQSSERLNPMYDERFEKIMKGTDVNNIGRGFYGQLPAEALKRETAVDEERARVAGISNLAAQLLSDSERNALSQDQLNLQKRNTNLGIVENAIDRAMNQENQNINNLFGLTGLQADDRNYKEGTRRFDVGQDNWQQEFGEGQRQFDVGQDNFNRQFDENRRQFNVGQGNFNRQFDENNRRFDVGQDNWQQEFGEGQRQFDVGQGNWEKQFDFGKAADEANITGEYNGNRTLAGQKFDLDKIFNEAGLTGMYNEQKTMQGRMTDANIANMAADNARANRTAAGSGKASSADQGLLLQGMLSSGNPQVWLEQNADWLGGDDYKFLAAYAKGAGMDTSKLFANASQEQKGYYKSLKDIYTGGAGDRKGQYKNNPEAALAQLQSEPYNRELLGSLYPVLENELASLVKSKNNAGDTQVDNISNEMIGSADPMAVLNKYKGKLNADQIKTLTAIAKSLKPDEKASEFWNQD